MISGSNLSKTAIILFALLHILSVNYILSCDIKTFKRVKNGKT